jgi:MoxR-like ATPase
MRIEIEHIGGKRHEQTEFFDQDVLTVGREEQMDISYDREDAPGVSREHCQICFERGGFWLYDGDRKGRPSTNYTYVNGKKATFGNATRLSTGDIIQFSQGGPQIVFRIAAELRGEDGGDALDFGDGSRLDDAAVAQVEEFAQGLLREASKVFSGKEDFCTKTLVAVLSGGHILYEGVPGVGKTTMVHTLSQILGCTFKRIQFTPDLLPSDITGVHMFDQEANNFVLRKGPIFANIVLADEINRAPAKTQAALLEAMQEKQVTIEGVTMTLPPPFVVLATQNPIESEGVYSLPEAQMDRFLMRLLFEYPSVDEEFTMLSLAKASPAAVEVLSSKEQLNALQRLVEQVHVDDSVMKYIVEIIHYTRAAPEVKLGCSPRGSVGLLRASRAQALCYGRSFVVPDDVKALSRDVLTHRVILNMEAELAGVEAADVIDAAVEKVPVPQG